MTLEQAACWLPASADLFILPLAAFATSHFKREGLKLWNHITQAETPDSFVNPSPHSLIARRLFAASIACSLLAPGIASGEALVPAGIKVFHQGDSLTGNGSALTVINGAGMTKPDPADPATWAVNSTAWQDDWQGFEAPGGINRTWAVLDLGAPAPNLARMFLWNVQENAPGNQANRGMNSFQVFHATTPTVTPPPTSGTVTPYDFDSGGWTQLSGTLSLQPGSGIGDAGQSFDVSGAAGARYIGLQILSNHGGNRVGFGEIAFTTEVPTGAPSVATLPATNVTASSARIRGHLSDPGDSDPTVFLYWGPADGGTTPGDWAAAVDVGSRNTVGEFSADLVGLAPATTYHFRAFGTNPQGDDWAPASESFTTSAALPEVRNIAASNILGTGASIGGTVHSTGGEIPTLVIHYGDNDAGTGAWDSQLDLGPQNGSQTGAIPDLTPGTVYYFRAAATNSAGTAWAPSSASFTTTPVTLPGIINLPATGINGTFATLNGEVTDAGGDPPAVTMYYGLIDGGNVMANWQFSASGGIQSNAFSRQVSNLQPETTYYVRALAENAAGQVWASPSLSFTTPVHTPPSVVINEIHYDEDTKTVRAEFIELHNPSDAPVDLSGCYFSDGIDFTFPGGTTLAAGGYVVVAEDPATMVSRFGFSGALGPFANGTQLRNSGEQITLRDPAGTKIDEVDYQLGFPWPTVGDDIGSLLVSPSIELIHPLMDNDLGGSWRASGFPVATIDGGGGGGSPVNHIAGNADWKYLDDGSDQGDAWRASGFDDSSWSSGGAELGYGDGDEATTVNSGPAGSRHATTYFRKSVTIPDPGEFVSFTISITYDDAYAIYVNGNEVARHSGLAPGAAYDDYSSNTVGDNANDTLSVPSAAFSAGTNLVAVEMHQTSGNSSDISFALSLTGEVSGGTPTGSFAPTPGAVNRSFATNAPPQIRQVDHAPELPASGQDVVVTAKITDPDGVGTVSLAYQIVEPGDYFCRYLKFNNNGIPNADPRYEDPSEWTTIAMTDDGMGGDALAADSIYSVVLPAALQTHRRLVRYRISAADTPGTGVTVPYNDDPQPNFAYFIHDGTPDWSGVIRPGDTPVNYPGSLMSSIPTYFLLSTNTWVDDSQFGGYGGSEYLWPGTLVYDGEVYDHIQYRPRGGTHRFQYGKNFWKFAFPRGHRFEARDDDGNRYKTDWKKLNLSSIVQQVGFNHRGEQGLFEGVGFRLFELCGVPASKTHYNQLYVVDRASATGANQYEGDYYGLFLSIEQMDGRFLDEHGLPDGNLYKIEGHNGESNNQGPTQPDNRSDVNAFISAYRNGTPTAQWWRNNFEVENYLSYRTVVEGIHHYDIAYGKNYFYYHNPESGKFQILPWDLDLTWADNMFGNGNHNFKTQIAQNPAFNTDYQNRVREIMDLIYNTDEGYRLIDETVRDVWTPGSPSLVGADRRLWDNNPRLNSRDRYYDIAADREFSGMIQILKNYIVSRGSWMTSNLLTQEGSIPATPGITYVGGAGFHANDLRFSSSSYSSSTDFAAMEWRISEVYNPTTTNYVPGDPYIYEIEGATESGELTSFQRGHEFSTLAVRPGRTYRARVRHKDAAGRFSHWSAPVEFLVSPPDVTLFVDALRLTELHYHPAAATPAEAANGWDSSDFEFVELQNIGLSVIDLTDVRFTKGADFDFPAGTLIAPGAHLLVVKNQAAFESRYGAGKAIAGQWASDDQLSNGGENVKLSLGAGTPIIEFTYDDIAPWPTEPDGNGFSLTLHVPDQTLPSDHADPLAWRASRLAGGAPGDDDHLEFATWASDHGLGAEAAHTDDPDRDGLNNLMEYALGLDPANNSSANLPRGGLQVITVNGIPGNYLTLSFRRQVATRDLTYWVEISGDLSDWQSSGAILMSSSINGDGTATEVWRVAAPTNNQAEHFIRLKVEG
jgi:hypothetical protein